MQPPAGPGGEGHAGAHPAVGEPLTGQVEGVRFCVGASLEPYDGALAQLRASGPGEAVKRARRCLLDTLFDHADAASVAELDRHRAHLLHCYGRLATLPSAGKPETVTAVTSCLAAAAVVPAGGDSFASGVGRVGA